MPPCARNATDAMRPELPASLAWSLSALLSTSCAGAHIDTPPIQSPSPRARVPDGWIALTNEAGSDGWARRARDPKSDTLFILVEPGDFLMGSPPRPTLTGGIHEWTLQSEQPQHRVRIPRAFYLSESPTTFEQFRAFIQATGH